MMTQSTKAAGRGREGRILPRTKACKPRTFELDAETVAVLKCWKREQARERLAFGPVYEDNGLVFPRPDGRPFHPEAFSKTFDRRL